MASSTPYKYRLEKDGTYTPLFKDEYESETANLYAKGSAYRYRVEQLIKKDRDRVEQLIKKDRDRAEQLIKKDRDRAEQLIKKVSSTPYKYRLEKDGTYTPLFKDEYESETANLYAKGSAYRDRVEQLIKKVNNHA